MLCHFHQQNRCRRCDENRIVVVKFEDFIFFLTFRKSSLTEEIVVIDVSG